MSILVRSATGASILVAMTVSACAPPGYVYEVGNFVRPHPTLELCASRGQVLDMGAGNCVTPTPAPPPTPMQVAERQESDAIKRQRDVCVGSATTKFRRQADGPIASHAIWRSELKQCEDLVISRLTAQRLKSMGVADCAKRMDWILRYRSVVYDPDQQAMAEDRYTETCGVKR